MDLEAPRVPSQPPNYTERQLRNAAGTYDPLWNAARRPVYGKIRYMSFAGTTRKFDGRACIEKWNG